MKVIKERTFTVKYVIPENETEKHEIEKIIEEVNKEKLNPEIGSWEITDNRGNTSS